MAIDLETADYDECIQAARDAEAARRVGDALVAWETVRNRFPGAPAGYYGAGDLLRDLGRLDEAEALLVDGEAKAPGDERIAAAHAWVTHSRGDLIAADRRWSALRANFPLCFDGYFGGGDVLRNLGRFDEADAVYRTAFGLFPMASHLLADFAAVAQSRGDLEEATRRWTTLNTLFPDEADAYLRQTRSYRESGLYQEAEAVLEDAGRRFAGDARFSIELAYVAVDRGAWAEALRRWEAVITTFHGRTEGYLGAAQALNELGRGADAETVLAPALRLFPDSAEVAVAYAWAAYHRQHYAVAVQRWEQVRRRFPRLAQGYTGGNESLLAAGQAADAAALIAAAQPLFPNDFEVAAAYARSPEVTQDWDEALARWSALRERFPARVAASVGYAQCCLTARRLDAADAVLTAALGEHAEDFDLNRLHADCAVLERDWAAAEARWRRFTELFPERAISWYGLGDMLRESGRFAESETVLTTALERFPGNRDLERALASTATARRDWPVALGRWEALKTRYPQDAGVADGIADALWHARQDLGVIQSDPDAVVARFVIPQSLLEVNRAAQETDPLRDLLMEFESLGDTCEFGIVQRRYGAEPIGLLRWTSTPLEHLVTALDSDFAGVGEPAHTVITVSADGEYTSYDGRYHMNAHTFTLETAEPVERFTMQYLKRMRYLCRKLLDDLATGDKVFVYKSEQGVTDAEARALFAAMRRHGPARLLCVRLQTAAHPTGTLIPLEDGLFMGHIDRFSTVDINVDVWIELCRGVVSAASQNG